MKINPQIRNNPLINNPKLLTRKLLKGEIDGTFSVLSDDLSCNQRFLDSYLLTDEEFKNKHSPFRNANLRMTDAEVDAFELKQKIIFDLMNSNQKAFSKIIQHNVDYAIQKRAELKTLQTA
jgi:hypothetical protein